MTSQQTNPEQASDARPSIAEVEEVPRREFLHWLSTSAALAGLSGCAAPPTEKIVPYVRAPEDIVPGQPLYFASAFPLSGWGQGVLVESHMGRPTKIEGNPDHPASLGATTAYAQASLLTLYDPDRSQVVREQNLISTWGAFYAQCEPALRRLRERGGKGLRILTGTVTSPTLLAQLDALLRELPSARWHCFDPATGDGPAAGAQLSFGEDVRAIYQLTQADVILALDADFLCAGPGCLRYARDFAERRRPYSADAVLNRLYAVEAVLSNTGAFADNRLALRPSEIEPFACALARAIGLEIPPAVRALPPEKQTWVQAIASDLLAHRSRSVVIVGEEQTAFVHALAHAMNEHLNNVGKTVVYTETVATPKGPNPRTFSELTNDMRAADVDLLLMLDVNPVYAAAGDSNFGRELERIPLRVHWGLYNDETAARCQWHLPAAHYLESWSDIRAFDGTTTIIQPLIAPLYAGKTAHEVLSAIAFQPERTSYDIIRSYWQQQWPREDFDVRWQTALDAGVIADSQFAQRAPALQENLADVLGREITQATPRGDEGLELVIRLDPTVYDGSFANNGWLQELPKPLTRLTWDNAVFLSPATAALQGLTNADVVEVHCDGRMVRGPVWILPGQADGCINVHLGYGRTLVGKVGEGAGFSAYPLRSTAQPWMGRDVSLQKTGTRGSLACTQTHFSMEGRDLVRSATWAGFKADPAFAHQRENAPAADETLYPPWQYDGHAWGMSVDLNTCTGCAACVVACQAENNIPVVGREQVLAEREMHWLRIDRYFTGEPANPQVAIEPVMCMHCEHAPCELVCPVGATTHSAEGLNDMVYNRCVGTRYCSNNCPYKVRRFNFLQFSDETTPVFKLLRNPDVTVRSRGVMEKCTYCVQRINGARINSEVAGRTLRDGDIVTACQAACPTRALIFGDTNDPSSEVSRRKALPLNYDLLAELNTRPRTSYLARVRNPNPLLERELA
ncbi:MAG TPA: 4Fe-4S dicluster domain-containing protein [Pirellulales bacterium]|jgi:molybdopterin-containing oxidoreductase family iron-sulfur binding subunit